jgi:hypothetical protein
LALLDTRIALSLAPDHVRSYERMIGIAEGLKAPRLAKRLKELVAEVKKKAVRSSGEWHRLAARAIGICSLPAIILDRIGKLTEERIEEFVRVGIEDHYTPVTVGPDILPPLPWLTEDDIEQL